MLWGEGVREAYRKLGVGLSLYQGRIQDFGKGEVRTKTCRIRAHTWDVFPSF